MLAVSAAGILLPMRTVLAVLGVVVFLTSAIAAGSTRTYRGLFFEVQYPASFKARNLDGASEKESNAATFRSPDGSVELYVFSPQWAGDAPGIALDTSKEVETDRSSKKSGTGAYTWYTIAAKDRSWTRTYQDFSDPTQNVHWVIGLKYRSEADFARHKAAYLAFKKSLKQFAD